MIKPPSALPFSPRTARYECDRCYAIGQGKEVEANMLIWEVPPDGWTVDPATYRNPVSRHYCPACSLALAAEALL